MIQERPKEPADDILIVDDVPENLNLLERILIGAGYRVRTATGGDIALRSVGVKAPALVLLDVRMPDPDGYEVCRRLKADARTAGIPVIFISALEDESQKVRGFHMGAVDYIGKPFHSEEVLARVNTHLSLRRARMDLERRVRERTEELAAAIAKLEAEVAERKRDEEKIRKALAEKDILLRELYHRTNNNMQIICSIFNLRLREIPDEGTQRILMDMINRINSMAIVHDLLYKSKDLSRIDLREYIVDLTGFLLSDTRLPEGKVRIDLTALEEVTIPIDYALPCGLVLNELISNVLKHAFPGDRMGTLAVLLRRSPRDGIRFSVSDDGVGVPENFDFRNETKMGYLLVFSLIEDQLGGSVEIITRGGLTCTVTFRDDRFRSIRTPEQ